MSPAAKPVMLGVAGSLLALWVAAAVLTNGALTNDSPPMISRPLPAGPTNLDFAPQSSAPIVHPGKPAFSQPLGPGVYQTRPSSIILVVPRSGLDDGGVIGGTGPGSRMPVLRPELHVVPVPRGR